MSSAFLYNVSMTQKISVMNFIRINFIEAVLTRGNYANRIVSKYPQTYKRFIGECNPLENLENLCMQLIYLNLNDS